MSKTRTVAPYGSWKSPITADLLVAGSVKLGGIVADGNALYWAEGRPTENGRNAIVRYSPDSGMEEMLAAGFNARSLVHEYGGRSFAVHDDVLYFANFGDQRVYRQYPLMEPEPITPLGTAVRFIDFEMDRIHDRLICVREDHRPQGEAVNSIISLPLYDESDGLVLVEGADFYSTPRLSPNGRLLAWLAWQHPNMPWDGTELWLADVLPDGTLGNPRQVAGGRAESIFQPTWSPDGTLYFVSDRTDWWNLYRLQAGEIEHVYEMTAEFGRPQWGFGGELFAFADADSIICTLTQNGQWQLARLDLLSKSLTTFDLPFTTFNARSNLVVANGKAIFTAGSAILPDAVVQLDLDTAQYQTLRVGSDISIDDSFLSHPQPIEFPTDSDLTAHAIFYPPKNGAFAAPENEKPPVLVISHGGPTSATKSLLNPEIQYWTSRGIGILDVNYGGSTGYGRSYRQRLNGTWGIVDVADCINGAKYLVENGLADGQRLAIRGGSAGGYTTLSALAFHDFFNAGASFFGISDLETLATGTHKFESRYLDNLIGPYPEDAKTYRQRSPIHFVEQISCPLILFQGLEDKVVPPDQSEKMFEAVKLKELPVAYIGYEGEQHGFRRADNIKHSVESELYFYGKVFGFELAESVKSITIENLD